LYDLTSEGVESNGSENAVIEKSDTVTKESEEIQLENEEENKKTEVRSEEKPTDPVENVAQ